MKATLEFAMLHAHQCFGRLTFTEWIGCKTLERVDERIL